MAAVWHGIYGHDRVVERFRRAIRRGRLASAFLFIGPAGIGKRTFAERLAAALLCRTREAEQLDPCGDCDSCNQLGSGAHPDFHLVAKPVEKSFLPLELLIGDHQHRMREGLCHDMGLKPMLSDRRVAIIDDADYLNAEGANCLLKTLEEPPPQSVLILIATSAESQLPTIRSRTQHIRFKPLATQDVRRLLLANQVTDNEAEAGELAELGQGSVRVATELADPEIRSCRDALLAELARPGLETPRLVELVAGQVERAGTESPVRRARLRQLVQFAVVYYQQRLRLACGVVSEGESAAAGEGERVGEAVMRNRQLASAMADRCLSAFTQLDRNVHLRTHLECWLDDLVRIAANR